MAQAYRNQKQYKKMRRFYPYREASREMRTTQMRTTQLSARNKERMATVNYSHGSARTRVR